MLPPYLPKLTPKRTWGGQGAFPLVKQVKFQELLDELFQSSRGAPHVPWALELGSYPLAITHSPLMIFPGYKPPFFLGACSLPGYIGYRILHGMNMNEIQSVIFQHYNRLCSIWMWTLSGENPIIWRCWTHRWHSWQFCGSGYSGIQPAYPPLTCQMFHSEMIFPATSPYKPPVLRRELRNYGYPYIPYLNGELRSY